MINGTGVNKNNHYRIQNDFDGSNNSFWYHFNSNGKELNSHCTNEKTAEVYKGDKILENADLIRQYKNAKLIQV